MSVRWQLFNGTALLPTSRSTFRRSLFLWNVDWCAWASRSTSLKTAGLCNVPTSAYWQVISTGFLSKQIKYNVTVFWSLRVRFTTEKRVLAVMSLVYLWTFWKTFFQAFYLLKQGFGFIICKFVFSKTSLVKDSQSYLCGLFFLIDKYFLPRKNE